MQLALDAADRLVEALEERRCPLPAAEAAELLFALRSAPAALARELLEDVVRDDARLAWAGGHLALASGSPDPAVEQATFVVFDLETTGLSAAGARICEIGAVRVRRLAVAGEFQTLVDPRVPLPPAVSVLTGLRDAELRRAPPSERALRRFLAFAGDAVLVAHNARFDSSFVDAELGRLTGRRLAAPVLDTVRLARRLVGSRSGRTSLAALAHFFGASVRPCHRALPDAQATAEVLIALVGLAQERGARTVADLFELSAPRRGRVYGKRSLAHGAPAQPGVYLFRGGGDTALYVGRARNLRARLRSYFTSDRQRPSVEAALAAVERIEWRLTGSELEAGLGELRLIRELRPPANARQLRSDRYVYLGRRGDGVVVTAKPGPLGPIRTRRRAELAARALAGATTEELDGLLGFAGPLPRLRRKLQDLSDCLRYEDAARLRDRIAALEGVVSGLRLLESWRRRQLCVVAPAVEAGWHRAFLIAGGTVCAVRSLPPGGGSAVELESGVAQARLQAAAGPSHAPEHADELLLLASFLRHPAPELHTFPLASDPVAAWLRARERRRAA